MGLIEVGLAVSVILNVICGYWVFFLEREIRELRTKRDLLYQKYRGACAKIDWLRSK